MDDNTRYLLEFYVCDNNGGNLETRKIKVIHKNYGSRINEIKRYCDRHKLMYMGLIKIIKTKK